MNFLSTIIRKTARVAICLILGGVLSLLAVFVLYLENRPDLNVWHKANLDAEFTIKSQITDFRQYLELEERLFQQLEERVYDRVTPEERHQLNRFNHGSMSDPTGWPRNWNRTFVLARKSPKAGVLLLHGMSDSPYSLREIGKSLHEAGAMVIGLRLPGHGTAPSGLMDMRWEDMAAAVKLATQYLFSNINGHPFYIIGYSNGSGLAVHYALSVLDDPQLPRPEGLVLISPAIGITPLAAFAVWQARLGHLLGLDKLAWNEIKVEYDPYKYNSFTVNAGDQVYQLTREIQKLLRNNTEAGKLQQLPPMLAFQSVVDTTVSVSTLVAGLFDKLPESGHELVFFDLNRINQTARFFRDDPKPYLDRMLYHEKLPYGFTFVTNENETSSRIHLLHKDAGTEAIDIKTGSLVWPEGIHSLAHVSLPFPKSDPLNGTDSFAENPGVHLGNIALRGERGVLRVAAADMLRLRWNPFYPFIEERISDFVGLRDQ
jgi:alpha-beta hydrolase superfamily lysophospholipase